nr:MAG TPA: hypothetical protein [Bacteriophage sp.]
MNDLLQLEDSQIMALPVINTIFVIVILLFDIKPFIKTVINEFKEITK